jgi:hypothetical protein
MRKQVFIAEPPGDTYALDQRTYETTHDPTTGLGPVFNARACSDCHQNPVSGGASQFTELRAGHLDATGNFVNPTVFINDGANTIMGRSLINDRAVVPEAQEHIPASENIRALRAALNTLGDGFVEAIASIGNLGKVTADPEDVPDSLGLADIDHFAQFLRGTKAPPRDAALAATPAAQAGQSLFVRPRFMHNLASLSLASAIERHKAEADDVRENFDRLSDGQKQDLFTFLNSL